jgi:type IV secretion system protein VirB9
MKIILAASVFALAMAPAAAQSVASPPLTKPATSAREPLMESLVRRARPNGPISTEGVQRVAAVNRQATEQPRAFVSAKQVLPFSSGAIYQVYAAPGVVTDIALQPGEGLVAVAAGDTARWVIGDTTSGSGTEKRTHILVKPFASGLATNLVITTDRRSYHLQLTATARTAMAALSWIYPADQLIALRRAAEQAAAAAPIADGLAVDSLHFDCAISGDQPTWRPLRAFDDGRQTFVEFPAQVALGEAPPIFIIGPTKEAELVNYRVRGRFYVIDRIFDAAELRLGTRKQQIVRIDRVGVGSAPRKGKHS